MPKGFTPHEKELIRQRLMEQGLKQFSVFGLKKTSVEELALSAGISKAAFYSFFESKEVLFMDVIEQVETRVRQEILAVIDLPGPSPRARLFAVLKKAFTLFREVPILQFLSGGDFDLLFRRIPDEKLQEHLASDGAFFEELIARCRSAGIPIQVPIGQITALLYTLVFSMLHEDDFGQNNFGGSTDMLLELVAAFCLGEVELQLQPPASSPSNSHEGRQR